MSLILNIDKRPAAEDAATLSEAEMAAERNREISALRATYPRMSYASAHDQVRNRSPHLFGLPARGSSPSGTSESPAQNREADVVRSLFRERKELVEATAKELGISFKAAWNLCRNRRPTLFSQKAEAVAASGPVLNRGGAPVPIPASKTSARAIDEEIIALRDSDNKLTYSQARSILRNRKPALFGIAA